MNGRVKNSLVNLGAVAVAAVLFAAMFPNIPFKNGLPFLAWFAYVPVFWVTRRAGLGASVILGALYGYAAYGLFNYWLSVFHPLASILVGAVYSLYMAVLFLLLHLSVRLFPKRGYILQFLLWMAYEYLRTLGFLGYSYGITGYSQWQFIPLIQIASVTGVWGVSALVVFPSAWLASAFSREDNKLLSNYSAAKSNAKLEPKPLLLIMRQIGALVFLCAEKIKAYFRVEKAAALIWCALLVFSLVFGFASQIDYSQERKATFALIQNNTDPWLAARAPTRWQQLQEFASDFSVLRDLSDQALSANPYVDFVVWSETAFVPRIYWQLTIRDDRDAWYLVRDLLEYLAGQEVPFIIGNHHAIRDPVRNPFGNNSINYNAALLFKRGEIVEAYGKIHLVPFTEHFPVAELFPFGDRFPRIYGIFQWIYRALREEDTTFWDPGTELTIFEAQGIRFATPICFEDTFGYINRKFTLAGAEVFVNLSNDAWAQSLSSQMQHLTMAVFRSVENRRSMVRATASGQTAAIDPNGRVIAMAEPFVETFLIAKVPIMTVTTIYTRFGDFLGLTFTIAAFAMLITGGFSRIMTKVIGVKQKAHNKKKFERGDSNE